MLKTRISIVAGLVGNAWTLYLAVYYLLSFIGATTIAEPLAFLAGLAAIMEPILTYWATGTL